jgi:hypothetical protein
MSSILGGSFHLSTLHTIQFLFILTVIQFWWIAIWGLAYIIIDVIAGRSKTIECLIYACMLVFTVVVIHYNPKMLEKL